MFTKTGNTRKAIKRVRSCVVYRSLILILLVFDPALAMLILVGGPSIKCYHTRLLFEPLQYELNHLLKWFGIVVDWCALAEAGLHVDVHTKLKTRMDCNKLAKQSFGMLKIR